MINRLIHYFNLEPEIDGFETIRATIEKDLVFKGTNLWILIFAIVLASVGLNINSTAVIIGAMLISPLMGPINGIGYSLATNNFHLLRIAIKNFGFAVGAGLVASTLYFFVTPVSVAHSELLARTSPTIYDVLIALFGGLAGMVALSSKQKGNVIPGVAIATALMPPLCTAGYGLGTGQYSYFIGAFYLFIINTVFIAFGAVIISRLLKFPIVTEVDKTRRKRITQLTSVILALTLVPSIYFGYKLVQKEEFFENATRFTKAMRVFEGNYQMSHEIDPKKKSILMVYAGASFTEEQKRTLKKIAENFSIDTSMIHIQQGFFTEDIIGKASEAEILKGRMNELSNQLKEKEKQIDSIYNIPAVGKQILSEIKAIYPQLTECSYAESYFYSTNEQLTGKTSLVVFVSQGKPLTRIDKKKIILWVKARIGSENVRIYFETN